MWSELAVSRLFVAEKFVLLAKCLVQPETSHAYRLWIRFSCFLERCGSVFDNDQSRRYRVQAEVSDEGRNNILTSNLKHSRMSNRRIPDMSKLFYRPRP